jgi:hypothetical protein
MLRPRLLLGNFVVDEPVIILGYHGTSNAAAEQILQHGYQPSRNEYDWLGDGIYFWQDAPLRAWEWADKVHGLEGTVLVSSISLSDCMDFLDIKWSHFLSELYDSFLTQWKRSGLPLPSQERKMHRLDRAVINYACGVLEEADIEIRSVRSAFREGKPVYPDSAICHRSHVQIAVRDSRAILETRKLERNYPNG